MSPGVHSTQMQIPEEPQIPHGHCTTGLHSPRLLHTCLPLPSQRRAPGTQFPVHVPYRHAYGQATGAVKCPVESQVCPAPLSHTLSPGAQTPWHTPAMQVWETQSVVPLHRPFEPHVWTPLPEHRVAPSEHEGAASGFASADASANASFSAMVEASSGASTGWTEASDAASADTGEASAVASTPGPCASAVRRKRSPNPLQPWRRLSTRRRRRRPTNRPNRHRARGPSRRSPRAGLRPSRAKQSEGSSTPAIQDSSGHQWCLPLEHTWTAKSVR